VASLHKTHNTDPTTKLRNLAKKQLREIGHNKFNIECAAQSCSFS
jgi:hypothetical protein